jgi:hypothetical protein
MIAQLDSLRSTFHSCDCSQPARQWNNGFPFMAPFGRRHGGSSLGIPAQFDRLAGRGLEYNPVRRKTNALIRSAETAENGSLRIKLGLVVRVPETIPSDRVTARVSAAQIRYPPTLASVPPLASARHEGRRQNSEHAKGGDVPEQRADERHSGYIKRGVSYAPAEIGNRSPMG